MAGQIGRKTTVLLIEREREKRDLATSVAPSVAAALSNEQGKEGGEEAAVARAQGRRFGSIQEEGGGKRGMLLLD